MRIIISCLIIALSAGIICLISLFTSPAGSASVPGGYITGYVLDEDGKPVPMANVSLWQDGHLWQLTKYQYQPSNNPQMTRAAFSNENGFLGEGGFVFGYTYPGDYALTAEKDGYNGTASVNVNDSTTTEFVVNPRAVIANITLKGYHVPTFTPEQLSYTGGVAGEIRTVHGYNTQGVNVSLWQNGRIVDIINNPQSSIGRNYSGKKIDYLFEHLAPGRYTVMALDYESNESVTVDVGDRMMRADIVLSRSLHQPYGWSDVSFTPTVGEFSTSDSSKPTPAIPWLIALLTIGAVAHFIQKKKGSD